MLEDTVQRIHKLVDFGLPLLAFRGVLDAVLQMGGQDLPVDPLEQRFGGHDLGGDVDAVAIVLHHGNNAVQLTAGGLEQPEHLFLICHHG